MGLSAEIAVGRDCRAELFAADGTPAAARCLRMAVVVAAACIPCHFLCYYPVQEYHYTGCCSPRPSCSGFGAARRTAGCGCCWRQRSAFTGDFLADLHLPLAETPPGFGPSARLERVLPTAAVFLGLVAYAALGGRSVRLSLAKKGDRGSRHPVMLKHNLRAFGRR